jgi:hypothetical protein
MMLATSTRTALVLARAEALAVSDARQTDTLDRAAADALIRATLHVYGGVRGCAAALAQAFGDHPEIAAPRMRWARQTVTALY